MFVLSGIIGSDDSAVDPKVLESRKRRKADREARR